VNLVDVVIIGILIFALVAGLASGAFPQLGGLAGAIGGGAFSILVLLPVAQNWLQTLDPPIRAVVVLVGIVGIVGLGEAIGSGIGSRIRERIVDHGFLGGLDRAAGGLLGLAQGVLVVWLVGGVLAAGPVPSIAAAVQHSGIVRGLAGVLPPPTEIVGELGKWLDASGLPDVFIGFEPFPAAPVDPPTDAEAQAIAAKAVASTFLVRADACGYVLSGTGFVVKPGYIVTNAHVVAGSNEISIGRDSGPQTKASAVLFDPELDIALLYVPGLSAPSLTLSDTLPTHGTLAAALGHPDGGSLTTIAAAVTNTYQAQGRDIYGTSIVSRQIIELQAAIQQGDSGGPLVLKDGTVGGVVFAEAQTDPNVGYALSPIAIEDRIQDGLTRKAPISTGDCTR